MSSGSNVSGCTLVRRRLRIEIGVLFLIRPVLLRFVVVIVEEEEEEEEEGGGMKIALTDVDGIHTLILP